MNVENVKRCTERLNFAKLGFEFMGSEDYDWVQGSSSFKCKMELYNLSKGLEDKGYIYKENGNFQAIRIYDTLGRFDYVQYIVGEGLQVMTKMGTCVLITTPSKPPYMEPLDGTDSDKGNLISNYNLLSLFGLAGAEMNYAATSLDYYYFMGFDKELQEFIETMGLYSTYAKFEASYWLIVTRNKSTYFEYFKKSWRLKNNAKEMYRDLYNEFRRGF